MLEKPTESNADWMHCEQLVIPAYLDEQSATRPTTGCFR